MLQSSPFILETDKDKESLLLALESSTIKQDMSGSLRQGPKVRIVIHIPTSDLSSQTCNMLSVWLAVEHKLALSKKTDSLEVIVANMTASRQSFGRHYETPSYYVEKANAMLKILKKETSHMQVLESATKRAERNGVV